MKIFAELISNLESTTSSSVKVSLLSEYFMSDTDPLDKLWATALFMDKAPSKIVNTKLLRLWCAEMTDIPLWLFEQNYQLVGDLAETIALMAAGNHQEGDKELHQWIQKIQQLKTSDIVEKKLFVLQAWQSLGTFSVWLLNKLITGGFRSGVSINIITKALSHTTAQDENTIAYHLSGDWTPDDTTWVQLFDFENNTSKLSKPYPYHRAYSFEENLGLDINPDEWLAEWKWDGIRGQLIVRSEKVFLWTISEELISENIPEFKTLESSGFEFVIDGEILAWSCGRPLEFQKLQTRAGRKNPSKKLMADIPVVFMAYDILEIRRADIRNQSFEHRRIILENVLNELDDPSILLSPLVSFDDHIALSYLRNKAKDVGAEGLILKKKSGIYHAHSKSGDMWEWKKAPYTIDAVLIYVHRVSGPNAPHFSDFTFALWDGDRLVPIVKTNLALSGKEMEEITTFVKNHTIEKYGPVISVKPELVFELKFEGISHSTRHKSGITVRLPHISRWVKGKSADEAGTLVGIKHLAGL